MFERKQLSPALNKALICLNRFINTIEIPLERFDKLNSPIFIFSPKYDCFPINEEGAKKMFLKKRDPVIRVPINVEGETKAKGNKPQAEAWE